MIFERIETSEEAVQALSQMQTHAENFQASSQAMAGNLEGLEVARSAHMKLDEEAERAQPTARPGICRPGPRYCWPRPQRIRMANMARRTLRVIQACARPPAALVFV